jgi:atypical dual specificity phosphatase
MRISKIKFSNKAMLYFGPTPGRASGEAEYRDILYLKEHGIRKIVCLLSFEDLRFKAVRDPVHKSLLAKYEEASMKYMHFPIEDYGTPDMEALEYLLDSIALELKYKVPIYIHCHAGLGRTGTVVACLLVRLGFTALKAVESVRIARPGTIETSEQEKFVYVFEKYREERQPK